MAELPFFSFQSLENPDSFPKPECMFVAMQSRIGGNS
jgi:hypothetical protein